MRRLVECIAVGALLASGACARATVEWRPSLVSQVPDSTPVRFTVDRNSPMVQGVALDWERGRPRVISGRDTTVVPDGATLEVRLREKAGHALAGTIIGWAVGAGLSYALCPSPKKYCGEEDPTPLVGIGLGALIGSKIKTDKWVSVRRDSL